MISSERGRHDAEIMSPDKPLPDAAPHGERVGFSPWAWRAMTDTSGRIVTVELTPVRLPSWWSSRTTLTAGPP